MFLFRLLSYLPLGVLHGLGAVVGWLNWLLSPSYRALFKGNVALAGLDLRQTRGAIAHAGRMLFEMPWLWLRPAHRALGQRARWEGVELIDSALAQGRGVVFMTPHMGSFEVTAQAYAERYAATHGPITVLFRPAHQAWVRELVDVSRGRAGLATAPATLAGVRQMIRALRRGETIGLLPDQVPPQGMGVWVPFFGRPAYTMTLGARLLQQTGAVPLLAWGERLPWGRGFVVHVRPGPEIPPGSSPECAAQIINQAMEALIRLAPEQYLWGYKRYKAPRALETDPAKNAS
ncbi:MAG: lysophospholipid acyltransferase family protein [Burkholderiaceae bacterium]|nr:lysophospholipid acyltransferase family protein [Roseateles sp.]MBV8471300.1 lysophospholipid acyltransferase family protein [Burkholderiaceae bacterium]